MKAFTRVLCLGLIVSLFSSGAFGALTRNRQNLLGKFYASNVKGSVTVISDGRIEELKKGQTILARGTVIDTGKDATATLVFSNGTGVFVDANTRFTVKIFEQEFFAPNNNLRVEPSNSNTLVLLDHGRVVISTPRLLSGTTMVYETDLASINIRGEKVMIETSDKQTHVAMIAGNASVNPRGPDGNFVSIGRRIQTGNEAFVKFTLGGTVEDAAQVVKAEEGKAAGGLAMGTATSAGGAGSPPQAAPISAAAVKQATEATVLRLNGIARTRLPGGTDDVQLAEGAKLPKGATIITEDAAELYLQPFPGVIATIRPRSTVSIERLSLTVDDGIVKKQTALLNLTAGSVISTVDPAKRDINDYGVRTPKGIAYARGTSFTVSVEDEGFSVATTADTVSFTLPSGDSYAIKAGNITITPSGGEPQPPVAIGQALASNPALTGIIQAAVTTVANVVQNNIGALPSDSATNLLTKVLSVATSALPAQASGFASQAVTAVTAPGASTNADAAIAAAAVTGAIVSANPTDAAQIAAAAVTASPKETNAIAAAAAHAAPHKAESVASSVALTLASGTVTASTVESATQLAAAVAGAVPAKAAPVAAAVMQVLAQANPQATPQTQAQTASVIAAGVTASVPDQAVPVAATMMKILSQVTPGATTQTLAQSGATLATAITSVVPEKAQPVATAVMQLLVESNPAASPGDTTAAAGLIAAAVSSAAPDQSAAIIQGVASAANQPASSVQVSAAASAGQASQIAQSAGSAASTGSQASQAGGSGAAAASQASQNSQSYAQSDGGGSSGSGSGGAGGSANGSGGSSSGSSNGQGSGTGNGGGGSGGSSSNVADNNSGSGAGTGSGTDGTGNTSTSITVTKFDPGQFDQLTPDLQAAQNAQSGVQFTPDPGGGTVNPPTPTIPPTNPIDYVTSASSNGQ